LVYSNTQLFLRLQEGRSLASNEEDLDDVVEDSTLKLSTYKSKSSCLSSTCLPTGIREETIFSLSGSHASHTVIEDCDCVNLPHRCQRVSFPVTFNVGTPFQKAVDVGRCLGSCKHNANHMETNGMACKVTRNRTLSIEGPNGMECVPVIDECECAAECFRVREFYTVYDYERAKVDSENSSPVKKVKKF